MFSQQIHACNGRILKCLSTISSTTPTTPVDLRCPLPLLTLVKARVCAAFLTTSNSASATYKAFESSKRMQKLINKKGAKTKKQWYKPHLGEPLEFGAKKTKKGISQTHSIRLRQLSHILYDKAVEIINTGELSQDLLDTRVEITSATVAKDMNCVNIYWDADRSDWQAVEKLLQDNSGKLRSLLISYHILGRIPHIVFVKDKAVVNLSELNKLFEQADYGPDYIPSGLEPRVLNNINNQIISSDVGIMDDFTTSTETDVMTMTKEAGRLERNPMGVEADNVNANAAIANEIGRQGVILDLEDVKQKQNSVRIELQDSNCDFDKVDTISRTFSNNMLDNCTDKNETVLNLNEIKNDLSYSINDSFHTTRKENSNVYGLDRDDMMRKVVAKTCKPPKSLNSNRTDDLLSLDFDNDGNSNANNKEGVFVDWSSNGNGLTSSSLASKQILKQKLERLERKRMERLLERDSVDM